MLEPPWYQVALADSGERTLREQFDEERTGTGTPSIGDVLKLWLPEATATIRSGWQSSAATPGTEGLADVDWRTIAMREYLFFPAAAVTVAATAGSSDNSINLSIVGVSFDWELWRQRRIDGLNE